MQEDADYGGVEDIIFFHFVTASVAAVTSSQ